MKNKFIAFMVAFSLMVLLASCVTSTAVNFDTDVQGAEVYVDGSLIGTTPTSTKMSNAIWEDPDVVLKKEGYKTTHVPLAKEVKTVNLVAGLVIWWPSLLWVYGPKANQNFMLTPDQNSSSAE